jgi:hypothetical protein
MAETASSTINTGQSTSEDSAVDIPPVLESSRDDNDGVTGDMSIDRQTMSGSAISTSFSEVVAGQTTSPSPGSDAAPPTCYTNQKITDKVDPGNPQLPVSGGSQRDPTDLASGTVAAKSITEHNPETDAPSAVTADPESICVTESEAKITKPDDNSPKCESSLHVIVLC